MINFDNSVKISTKDRMEIASILQEAFWEKLAWYFKKVSKEEAIILLEEALTYNLGFYCKENEHIMGVALLSKVGKPFLKIDSNIRKKIGWIRGMIFQIFFWGPIGDINILYLEMIAVSPNARGKGIGKKMLDYLKEFAESEGAKEISLDVIDNNVGAIKLYKREGFLVTKHIKTKPFTNYMGFEGLCIMKKKLY